MTRNVRVTQQTPTRFKKYAVTTVPQALLRGYTLIAHLSPTQPMNAELHSISTRWIPGDKNRRPNGVRNTTFNRRRVEAIMDDSAPDWGPNVEIARYLRNACVKPCVVGT